MQLKLINNQVKRYGWRTSTNSRHDNMTTTKQKQLTQQLLAHHAQSEH